MFDNSPMTLSRRMHKLTNFVDSIADVWSSKGEILKSPDNLPISSGI